MLSIGTIILCHKCGSKIAKVLKVIHDGSIIHSSDLEGIDQRIEDGDLMGCHKCGEIWLRSIDGRVYTKDGWMS